MPSMSLCDRAKTSTFFCKKALKSSYAPLWSRAPIFVIMAGYARCTWIRISSSIGSPLAPPSCSTQSLLVLGQERPFSIRGRLLSHLRGGFALSPPSYHVMGFVRFLLLPGTLSVVGWPRRVPIWACGTANYICLLMFIGFPLQN